MPLISLAIVGYIDCGSVVLNHVSQQTDGEIIPWSVAIFPDGRQEDEGDWGVDG